jgi:hypothetical protein
MTLRPPRSFSTPQRQDPLDYEIAREQASALGRLGRALERALGVLAEFDRAHTARADEEKANEEAEPPQAKRTRLVQEASNALWCFIIQRESCGLRDSRSILRAYNVPVEVHNRMGTFSPAIARK